MESKRRADKSCNGRHEGPASLDLGNWPLGRWRHGTGQWATLRPKSADAAHHPDQIQFVSRAPCMPTQRSGGHQEPATEGVCVCVCV